MDIKLLQTTYGTMHVGFRGFRRIVPRKIGGYKADRKVAS